MENWPEPPPLPPQLDPATGQPVPAPARANKVYLLLVFLLVTTSLASALLPDLRWLLSAGRRSDPAGGRAAGSRA